MQRERGQAAVETALALPLLVFCVLGTLQLFLLLQARVMAEYAVYRAVRAGSLKHGDCEAMKHAALVSVMPVVTATDSGDKLAKAFELRRDNRYVAALDGGHTGQIIELWREQPKMSDVPDPEDSRFDQPGHLVRLETRMVLWVRLKIPFADWVLGRMFLAWYGLKNFGAANPLAPVQPSEWKKESTLKDAHEKWPGGPLDSSMLAWGENGQFLFPVQVNYGMRLMTPARKKFFATQGCPL